MSSSNLFALCEAMLAKGLLHLNDAAGLAEYVLRRGDSDDRARASAERAIRARQAIVGAGIPLPAPRTFVLLREIDEEERAQAQAPGQWTIGRMAARAGVHRTTVIRWLQALGGTILERYAAAQDAGELTVFTGEEAREVLRQGSMEWVMDSEAGGAPGDEEGDPEDPRADTGDRPGMSGPDT